MVLLELHAAGLDHHADTVKLKADFEIRVDAHRELIAREAWILLQVVKRAPEVAKQLHIDLTVNEMEPVGFYYQKMFGKPLDEATEDDMLLTDEDGALIEARE